MSPRREFEEQIGVGSERSHKEAIHEDLEKLGARKIRRTVMRAAGDIDVRSVDRGRKSFRIFISGLGRQRHCSGAADPDKGGEESGKPTQPPSPTERDAVVD